MSNNPLLDIYLERLEHLKTEHPDRFNSFMNQPDHSLCFECLLKDDYKTIREKDVRLTYAFAVPNDEALATIAKYSPNGVVEIGAGRGYWANLIGNVEAYDYKLPGKGNTWFKDDVVYHPVQRGGPESIHKKQALKTLFLCWPYMDSMAYNSVKAYKDRGGETVIYVGEGQGGCTADDDFFKEMEMYWNLVETVHIPQWSGLHDRLEVYTR